MEKWIRAGNLPPMPVSVFTDQTELKDMNQLLNEIWQFLLNLFREEIDPELSERENLENLTETAKNMLAILGGLGLATEVEAVEIALEAMGKSRGMDLYMMLQEDMFQERIRSLAWTEENLFPISMRTDEMEDIPGTPEDWAELIVADL